MMANHETRTAAGGAIVVTPQGRLNMVAAPALRTDLHELVDGGSARIVIDLSGTTFIDSSGLGALVSGLKAARQAGGDLRIAAPSKQVETVLELTNLNRVLRSYPSVDAAFDDER
jgi:anti-sigma B factor antagonist